MPICRNIFLGLLSLLAPALAYSQAESLKIFGRIVDYKTEVPIAACRVQIMKEGQIFETLNVQGRSGYKAELPLGFVYDLRFETRGYFHKIIRVDTRNIPESFRKTNFEVNADGSLMPAVDGFNTTLFDVPYARMILEKGKGEFQSDQAYFESRKSLVDKEFERLKQLALEPQAWKLKFDSLLALGDAFMIDLEYYDAKGAFVSALDIYPQNPDALQKLEAAEEKIRQAELEKRRMLEYQLQMKMGDSLMYAGIFLDALGRFKSAVAIIPTIEAKEKIYAANQAILNEELWKSYWGFVKSGKELFLEGDYTGAIVFFEDALEIFPSENEPATQIDVCREAILTLDMLAKRRMEYDSLILAGNGQFDEHMLQSALLSYTNAISLYPSEEYPKLQIERIEDMLEEKGGLLLVESVADKPQPDPVKSGITIRNFDLGNKKIQEYEVVRGVHTDIYRRVQATHTTFYFYNGRSVTEDAWKRAVSKLEKQ